ERKDWLSKETDRTLPAEVVHNLIYLIAEISPGAKLGSTAPYGRAELVLVEAGDRQPRSLATAFRNPTEPKVADTTQRLKRHLEQMDKDYETGEARRALHCLNEDLPRSQRASLRSLAEWARAAVVAGEAKP